LILSVRKSFEVLFLRVQYDNSDAYVGYVFHVRPLQLVKAFVSIMKSLEVTCHGPKDKPTYPIKVLDTCIYLKLNE